MAGEEEGEGQGQQQEVPATNPASPRRDSRRRGPGSRPSFPWPKPSVAEREAVMGAVVQQQEEQEEATWT